MTHSYRPDFVSLSEAIEIVFQQPGGEEIRYRFRMNTAMGVVFEHYADSKGVERSEMIFRLGDRTEIRDHVSPHDVGLEHGDLIEVVLRDLSSLQQVQNELDEVQNELDAKKNELDEKKNEYVELKGRHNLLQEQFTSCFARAVEESNENEQVTKRQRNE